MKYTVDSVLGQLYYYDEEPIVSLQYPLGYGKTRGAIRYCEEKGYKYLIVVPNISNILDILASYDFITPFYSDVKVLSDKMVTTYQSFEHVIKQREFDVIIFDEFHIIMLDRDFRRFSTILDDIESLKCKKILITATPTIFFDTCSKYAEYFDNTRYAPFLKNSFMKSRINIEGVRIRFVNDLQCAYALIQQEDYDVVYHDSVLSYFDFCMHDYKLVHRYNLREIWNQMFDEKHNLIRSIFTTSAINTGVNILNKGKMKVAIVCGPVTTNIHIIQFLGRFRNAKLHVDFYIPDGNTPKQLTCINNTNVGKTIEYKFSRVCNNLDDVDFILSHFTHKLYEPGDLFDLHEYTDILQSDKCHVQFYPKRLFFRSYDIPPNHRDKFIHKKVRIKGSDNDIYVYEKYFNYHDTFYRMMVSLTLEL